VSLFALPVSTSDLTNLQKGIEFSTNPAEAGSEAAAINAAAPGQTVFSYADQLIQNTLPSGQGIVAVDSLMFGGVDTQAEMTTLSGFVAGQAAFFNTLPPATQTGAGGLIVWDAEVTGFALAGPNGNGGANKANFANNFASLNTGANAGTAGNLAFAQAVSTAIFGHTSLTGQVLAYLSSYIAYFTANPTALNGATLLQAADGITFGAEIGIALSNTTTIGAYLEGLVSNALIDNAEVLNGQGQGGTTSLTGISLLLLPAHTPLQGETVPFFTLTVGQDTVISGQAFSGNSSAISGPVVPSSDVVVSAPLANPLGFFNVPTLTTGDNVQLNGNNNTLNAFFSGAAVVAGETIQGVQTWNITNVGVGTVTIFGGANVGGPGPIGGTSNPGVQTLTFKNSALGGSTLNVGLAGTGIQSVLTAINSLFNGNGASLSVYEAKAAFAAVGAPTALAVTVNNGVTSTTTVDAGPDAGTTGYLTFNVVAQGGSTVTNTISLGATLATDATTVTLADDGANTTLLASTSDSSGAFNWAKLTSVAATATATGTENITGGETANGFLSALVGSSTAKFSITLDNAAGNVADLSSWAGTAANLTINLGTGGTAAAPNILALSSALADTTTAFGGLSGVQQLDDAGAVGGTVSMNLFPGVTDLTVVGAASGFGNGSLTSNWIINNAPAPAFTLNLQSPNLNGHSIGVAGAGAAGDTLTLDFGAVTNPGGTFQSTNYDNVIVNDSATTTFAVGGFLANATPGNNEVTTVNIASGATLVLANAAVTPTTVGTQLGHDTATVLGGTSLSPMPGTIDINVTGGPGLVRFEVGVTNASVISAPGNVEVLMAGADDAFLYVGDPSHNGDTVTAGGLVSILQGTMGPVSAFALGGGANGFTGAVSGGGATGDTLTDTAGASGFYGDGGGDAINLGGGGNTIEVGLFQTFATQHNQIITGAAGGFDYANTGFWGVGGAGTAGAPTAIGTLFPTGGGTSADMTTVTGFQLATVGAIVNDTLNINTGAWNGGATANHGAGELVQINHGTAPFNITLGASNVQLITSQGQLLGGDSGANVIAYGLGNIANAAGLVTALNSLAGVLTMDATTSISANEHILFAYASTGGDIKIADVDFLSGVAAGTSTQGATIAASDMFDLGHTNIDLLGISAHPADIQFSLITA
jgi:hypothetical protein